MRVDFYGLAFEAPKVTVYLWTPWRASALEHRLFEAVRHVVQREPEPGADELHLHIADLKTWRGAFQAVIRVLKGWQEDAAGGNERRSWRWLLESDTDAHGYDHFGEPVTLWAFLRVTLERGGPGEPEQMPQDIDLEGFTVRIWGDQRGI